MHEAFLRFAARQVNPHHGALSEPAFDSGDAAGLVCKPMHHGQSETAAFAALLGGEERLEDAFQHVRFDARSGVDHADAHEFARFDMRVIKAECRVNANVTRLQSEPAALRHRIACVDRQVENGVFKLSRIHPCMPQIGCEHGVNLDGLAQRTLQQLAESAEQPIQIRNDRIENLPARKRQQAPRKIRSPHGGTHCGADFARQPRIIADAALEQL